MNDLYKQPVFSFLHEDSGGVVTTKTFEAESWTKALENFVHFLKGVGFTIDGESIQVHESHNWDNDWTGLYCGDNKEPDWVHPDDSSDHLMDALVSIYRKAQGVQY
jgi:hypothetical protein